VHQGGRAPRPVGRPGRRASPVMCGPDPSAREGGP
jgi:hypothetical protein